MMNRQHFKTYSAVTRNKCTSAHSI